MTSKLSRYLVLLLVFLQTIPAKAQTVTIYRAGSALLPTHSSIKSAVANAIDNDSLVLSADTFKENNIVITSSLSIRGSQTSTQKTLIDAGILSDSSALIFLNPNFPSTINRLFIEQVDITNGHANNGFDAGGGAIYASQGTILIIDSNCRLFQNFAPDSSVSFSGSRNGGAIYSEGEVHLNNNAVIENNEAVNGGGIFTTQKLIMSNYSVVKNNIASLNGGGIYTSGEASFLDFSDVKSNDAKSGGACYSDNALIFLKNTTRIDSNYAQQMGAAFFLKNSYFRMSDSTKIFYNYTDTNIAAAIYCMGNSDLKISGGQIIDNGSTNPLTTGKGMGLYNDSLTGTSSIIQINNARIFNPRADLSRHNEFYNTQAVSAFLSDSTWWGESDTSGLIYNAPTATVGIRSWVICEWILNNGLPIDTASSFPLEAHFKLYTGSPFPADMFWMLQGIFNADSGSFSPAISSISAANIVSSTFKAPLTTTAVQIDARVDADFYKKAIYVQGTNIEENKLEPQNKLTVFPNPAKDEVNIFYPIYGVDHILLTITDIFGKQITAQNIPLIDQKTKLKLN